MHNIGELLYFQKYSDDIGYDYARTLREWRYNFMKNKQAILSLGYDEVFIKKWEYYFCYCEAGFEMEYLGDYQIVLTHPRFRSEESYVL